MLSEAKHLYTATVFAALLDRSFASLRMTILNEE